MCPLPVTSGFSRGGHAASPAKGRGLEGTHQIQGDHPGVLGHVDVNSRIIIAMKTQNERHSPVTLADPENKLQILSENPTQGPVRTGRWEMRENGEVKEGEEWGQAEKRERWEGSNPRLWEVSRG